MLVEVEVMIKAVLNATMFKAISYVRVEGRKTSSVLDVLCLSKQCQHFDDETGLELTFIASMVFPALHRNDTSKMDIPQCQNPHHSSSIEENVGVNHMRVLSARPRSHREHSILECIDFFLLC